MSRFEEQVEEVARHRALGNAEARRPVVEPVFKPAEGFAAPPQATDSRAPGYDPAWKDRKANANKLGGFLATATIVATLRNVMQSGQGQYPEHDYKDSHKLALEQITGRLGQIANGGASNNVHWREIELWARLMAEQLE